MEGIICSHHMYGYCKFKERCEKQHVKGECKYLSACKSKTCKKRHPKVCKRYSLEKYCKFGTDCAYLHMIDTSLQVHNQLKTFELKESSNELKIKELEDKVEILKSQILQLGILTQDLGDQVGKLTGDIIPNKKVTENSKNVTENKEKNINKLEVPERLKFRCSQCEFTSKKEITLKKHKNTKHVNSNMKLGEGQFGIVSD